VSITELTFGKEFSQAIEQKQIAQQQAEQAKYQVQKALQDKNSAIIKAEGEARSAELLGPALGSSTAYIQLKRIEAAREIAISLAKSKSRAYLDAETLMLNLTTSLDSNLEKMPIGANLHGGNTVQQQTAAKLWVNHSIYLFIFFWFVNHFINHHHQESLIYKSYL